MPKGKGHKPKSGGYADNTKSPNKKTKGGITGRAKKDDSKSHPAVGKKMKSGGYGA